MKQDMQLFKNQGRSQDQGGMHLLQGNLFMLKFT